jgi:two-component system sensor histidine kinase/response regulator
MSTEPPAPNERPTLLIVDDEEGPRQSLNVLFKGTYNILLADSGPAALAAAEGRKIDVAVLDIRMDGMTGTELLGKLKARDPLLEVIMLTAYETMDTAKEAIRGGACDYLTKPFEISVVRDAIGNAVARRRLADRLSGSSLRLIELQHELNDISLREELARTQNEIYESVMHDIGSPLTAISVLIQILNQDLASTRGAADPKMVHTQLQKVDQQVGRCIALSRRYLDYARQRASGQNEVMVNQSLRDVYELVAANPAARGNTVEINPMQVDLKAAINGTDLIQILINLVINALQSTSQPHHVKLSADYLVSPLTEDELEGEDNEVVIGGDRFINVAPLVAVHVEDDGDGMSPEIMAKIFAPYFSTKAPGKGTGLGLVIVARLLGNAQGLLRVNSAVGRGTCFSLYIPVVLS